MARSADVMLMVLDATRPDAHRAALEQELGACGVRLNQDPPDIYLKKKKTGGLKITPTVPLTKTDVETVKKILSEYKVRVCEGVCVCVCINCFTYFTEIHRHTNVTQCRRRNQPRCHDLYCRMLTYAGVC